MNTEQAEAEAVVAGLCDGAVVAGKRHWWSRPTTVILSTQQAQYARNRFNDTHGADIDFRRLEFGGQYCHEVVVVISRRTQRDGFQPMFTVIGWLCPVCGNASERDRL